VSRRAAVAGVLIALVTVAAIAGGALALSRRSSGAATPGTSAVAAGPVVTTPAVTSSTGAGAECAEALTAGEITTGTPTAAQRAAAAQLVARTRTALQPYKDFAVAMQRGFRSLDGMHYYSAVYYADGRILDPSRPEFVMYDNAHRLLGAMFVDHGRAGPQVGGPLTVWHTHCIAQMPCLLSGNRLVPSEAAECLGHPQVSDWMLHVWLVPNRLGPFGHQMVVPEPS
jgi:hypothetical protein